MAANRNDITEMTRKINERLGSMMYGISYQGDTLEISADSGEGIAYSVFSGSINEGYIFLRGGLSTLNSAVALSEVAKENEVEHEPKRFNGPDYNRERDDNRLTTQYHIIFNLMKDAKPRTLFEIERETGFSTASISAQLRHMRKPRNGSHTVNKENVSAGTNKYTLIVNESNEEPND